MNDKKWIAIVSIMVILFVAFGMINKNKNTVSSPIKETNYLMGTIMNLTVYDNGDDETIKNAFDVIRDIEQKMSLNIKTSEINKINAEAFSSPVLMSDDTAFVMKKSLEYSKLSDGHFDITIGPLVELWGIGSDDARVPKDTEISEAIDKIDYKNIKLMDKSISLDNDGMIIDLGGIAKGYAADKVAQYLKSQNVNRAIIDLGGNIFALGDKEKGVDWSVGVQNPFDETRGDYLGLVKVSNKSVVTSGVYERYLEADGKKYHHILDPFTGFPVDNELMSVTIVSDQSIDGDALSTGAFALGLDKGYELIESLDTVDAIFVTKDKKVFVTNGLKDKFELKNTDFKIIGK